MNYSRALIDFENSPCSLCGYEGRCLSAPPCVNCPAHPKVLNPASITQQEKERLIREAAGFGIELKIHQLLSLDRQHNLWYGGEVAEARKGDIRLDIYASGDVGVELYVERPFAGMEDQWELIDDVNDRCNDGAFAECMGKYIRDDEVLEKLLLCGEADGYAMDVVNNNWFEFRAFDESKGKWVGPDAIDNIYDENKLLDILTAENLMATFGYVEQYEAEKEEEQ